MSPLFSSIPPRAPPAQVLTSYRFPSTGPVKLSHEILNIWGLWALQLLWGLVVGGTSIVVDYCPLLLKALPSPC